MVKKKILPWLSVSALIFALPVNAAENNTFMAVTSACVIAAGMYAKYRTRKTDFC